MKFVVGADPEFYLSDGGTPISAHGIIPGTKDEPHPLPNGGAVQLDGVAVEFNIPPAETAEQFDDYIRSALNDIRKMVPNKYTFNFRPHVHFPKVYFDSLPPPVKVLGCDPDYNAYEGGRAFPSPSVLADTPSRSFGGHIHIGWGENLSGPDHIADCCHLVRSLESFSSPNARYIGNYTVSKELLIVERARQSMYGKPGAFRPKSYGVEWRSPSNLWLGFTSAGRKAIFRSVTNVAIRLSTGARTEVYYTKGFDYWSMM